MMNFHHAKLGSRLPLSRGISSRNQNRRWVFEAEPLFDLRWAIWEAQEKGPTPGVLDDTAGDEFRI